MKWQQQLPKRTSIYQIWWGTACTARSAHVSSLPSFLSLCMSISTPSYIAHCRCCCALLLLWIYGGIWILKSNMLLSIKGFSSGVQHSSPFPSFTLPPATNPNARCRIHPLQLWSFVRLSLIYPVACLLSLPLSPTASDTDTTRHFRLCNDAGLRFVPLMSTMYAPHTHTHCCCCW